MRKGANVRMYECGNVRICENVSSKMEKEVVECENGEKRQARS
jgi:hypothetical protein